MAPHRSTLAEGHSTDSLNPFVKSSQKAQATNARTIPASAAHTAKLLDESLWLVAWKEAPAP